MLLAVAALAMLIGFAGSATAGVLVTGKQIKDGTITSADLKDAGLSGTDVADHSLRQDDFLDAVIGPVGPRGDQGPPGRDGSSGLSYQVVGVTISKDSDLTWSAVCPAGTRVVSGGESNTGLGQLTATSPTDAAGTGWTVGVHNSSGSTISAFAWALCVTAP